MTEKMVLQPTPHFEGTLFMMRTRPRSICLSILAAVLVWCGCGSPPANADEPVVLQMNSDIPGRTRST